MGETKKKKGDPTKVSAVTPGQPEGKRQRRGQSPELGRLIKRT